jgi:hypothetical protein
MTDLFLYFRKRFVLFAVPSNKLKDIGAFTYPYRAARPAFLQGKCYAVQ